MIGWKKKIAAYLSLALLAGVICACGSVSSDQDQIPTEKEETTTAFDSTEETEETLPETETIEETEESAIETETGTETESETETISLESETATAEEMEISEMDALMYAQANVNIRASYSADSEKLGTLQKGTSIKVTGVTADQNWYRVEYKEAEAFVAASYLGLEKPAEEASAPAVETPAPTVETTAPAETQQTPAPDAQSSNPIPSDIGNGRALTNEDWNRMFEDPNFGRNTDYLDNMIIDQSF